MAKTKHTLSLDVQGDLFARTCRRCNQFKYFSEFHIDKLGRPAAQCIECRRSFNRARYEENREAVKERTRRWAQENREKMREYSREHYARNIEAQRARTHLKYLATRERTLERNRQWRLNNQERIRELHRAWYPVNYAKATASRKAWSEKNKDRRATYNAKRRAAQKNATPKWANQEKIREFYFASQFLGMVTGEWYHVDHIVPLAGKSVCGLHWEGNLQVIPGKDNWAKHNTIWPDMP